MKKLWKRTACLLCAAALCVGCAGCGPAEQARPETVQELFELRDQMTPEEFAEQLLAMYEGMTIAEIFEQTADLTVEQLNEIISIIAASQGG